MDRYIPGLYEDPGAAIPTGICPRCGGELYHDADGLCQACRAALAHYHQPTLQAVLEELDYHLQKYLSDNLRNTVYNALATKFNLESED